MQLIANAVQTAVRMLALSFAAHGALSAHGQNIQPQPHARLCLVRHGQSEWNAAGRFTGWTDIDLTDVGREEAEVGGEALRAHGLSFDRAFTSELRRAQNTLAIVLHASGQHSVPTMRSWRLNEVRATARFFNKPRICTR